MEEQKKQYDLEEHYAQLEKTITAANLPVELGRVRAAFELADRSHAGQKRKDGTPYVSHCIAAAIITAEMGLDEDAIIAALLHDCIEDTSLTHEDIAHNFGTAVADIVEGVTKLTRVQYTSVEEQQVENLRKMLLAMAKDIRVILIKMADRLHNMRTMAYQSEVKQRIKSLETMEVYAPIAHRLGMQKMKWELEDLSLQYLDPSGYKAITNYLNERMDTLETFMADIKGKLQSRLDAEGIQCTISSRIKHVYSIYRKMYAQKLDINGIFDLCAFRVIVDDISDCYAVLGIVHDMFKPMPGRIKDYISTPKPNNYRSVHTTVIGSEGIPFEVQIRTWEMHVTAEYGVAAHWKYKSGTNGVKPGDEEKFAWVRRLLETQQESDASDFLSNLKIDMFADEVFVFSPKGDVINLPAGATPIDFAYSIHSAIGNSMVGAKVSEGERAHRELRPCARKRRHRGDPHEQERPRPEPRLAAAGEKRLCPHEDQAVAQEGAARGERHERPRDVRARAAREQHRPVGYYGGRHSPAHLKAPRVPAHRRSLCRHRLRGRHRDTHRQPHQG